MCVPLSFENGPSECKCYDAVARWAAAAPAPATTTAAPDLTSSVKVAEFQRDFMGIHLSTYAQKKNKKEKKRRKKKMKKRGRSKSRDRWARRWRRSTMNPPSVPARWMLTSQCWFTSSTMAFSSMSSLSLLVSFSLSLRIRFCVLPSEGNLGMGMLRCAEGFLFVVVAVPNLRGVCLPPPLNPTVGWCVWVLVVCRWWRRHCRWWPKYGGRRKSGATIRGSSLTLSGSLGWLAAATCCFSSAAFHSPPARLGSAALNRLLCNWPQRPRRRLLRATLFVDPFSQFLVYDCKPPFPQNASHSNRWMLAH